MDTSIVRTTSDLNRPGSRGRLELKWRLRHTPGRASTLIGEWIVVETAEERREAA